MTFTAPNPLSVRTSSGLSSFEDRPLRYLVTDAPLNSPSPIWAVNLHGFYAGGGMYAEESRHLAESLGWRVLNPYLPGFGTSAPLPPGRVTPTHYAQAIASTMDHLGIDQAILLGHSMGAALAIAFAQEYPDRTLGVIYRDGCATTDWQHRRGLIAKAFRPFAPDMADLADLTFATLLDLPELFIAKRRTARLRRLFPDARANSRKLSDTMPVGTMLVTADLTEATRQVVSLGIPILTMWGRLDRITPVSTAHEFAALTNTTVNWVSGGHCWMLVDSHHQANVLLTDPLGQAFITSALARISIPVS